MSFVLIACGSPKTTDVDPNITFDESDYIDSPTEEEQVAQSQADKEFYKQAKAENDSSLCEKIEFIDLRKLCLQKTETVSE